MITAYEKHTLPALKVEYDGIILGKRAQICGVFRHKTLELLSIIVRAVVFPREKVSGPPATLEQYPFRFGLLDLKTATVDKFL